MECNHETCPPSEHSILDANMGPQFDDAPRYWKCCNCGLIIMYDMGVPGAKMGGPCSSTTTGPEHNWISYSG
jgi:hypothetical protein